MGNLQETLLETIEKDFNDIKLIDNTKAQRKELNILQKRIETAESLLGSKPDLLDKINAIKQKIQDLTILKK